MDINPGHMVVSKAGRDKGKKFIVLSVCDEDGYVNIADGNLRKVDNPKRKKLKHLEPTGIEIEKLALKLKEGRPLQNSEVQKAIRMIEPDEKHLKEE